ncbi:MAG TPA: universal stress protein [Acidimicrobiales bacterium]|nr:universal stress protein [Acidimicrobiales bacterium]
MPKVLVASDGSDFAIAAGRRGVSLLAPDSQVAVITVVPPPSSTADRPESSIASGVVYPPREGAGDERMASGRADVDATVAALGIEATGRVEQGDAGETICEVAGTDGFEIVVVGSHGSGLLKRALLGSVSRYVLHNAPCPVLVVRDTGPEDGRTT